MLKVEKVSFKYRENEEFSLSDIDLNIEMGSIYSIIGNNGSGKSTLIKILTGYLKPTEGIVLLNGINVLKFSRKEISKKISYVPQIAVNNLPYTVFEMVRMGRSPFMNLLGFEKDDDISKIEFALKLMDIYHLKNRGISSLSGGEIQRTYIARALAQDGDIIILDEPNSHLDIKHQIAIFKLLKKINKEEKKTVIFISHDLNLAYHFCDKMILLKDGRVVDYGEKSIILNEDKIYNTLGIRITRLLGEKSSSIVLDYEKSII